MKTEVLHIADKLHFRSKLKSVISFKKFVDFLKESIESGSSLKTPYFKWILKKFERLPELMDVVPAENLGAYEEILELISTCLLPLASDEKSLWALTNAASPDIFYSTDGFHDLQKSLRDPVVLNPLSGTVEKESEKIIYELQYGLIMEKLYNQPYFKKNEFVRKFIDPETGLDRYFLVNIDTRFIDIYPVDDLPEFDCSAVLPTSFQGEEFKKLKHMLPLQKFEARGFSVLTLTDVTAQQAVEQIGRLVINSAGSDLSSPYRDIIHSLQTIVGSKHFRFGIVPFLQINERPALLYENFPFSIIIQACWKYEVSKKEFNALRNDFTRNPRIIIWSANEKESELPELIGDAFRHAGITTYIVFPVYQNRQLTGIFEISTKGDHPMMNEEQMIKLRPALPLMTQLIQNLIGRFNSSIENIIKEKFTSIQPAVQWKFNETAWHYLRDHVVEDKKDPVENITFLDLYPLYGAVDIKNSTILRNEVLAKDYEIQLRGLTDTVYALDFRSHPQVERILDTSKNWLEIIQEPLTTQQEIRLNDFFNLDVQSELENLILTEPETKQIIQPYFYSLDEENGNAFQNRRRLENAIQQLNSTLNNFFEEAAGELQQIYPCYFEKFRTDGVEYDIYVGQSIAPNIPFSATYLEKMKRWQLESMVRLVKLVREIMPSMPYPLQSTQLLFIHPQTIDISFRKDERRFDVEGAYNIRYQIIKKRIDKVNIQNTGERLTQPEKIALVYFNERDAEEYKKYIRQMQDENLLMDDLEDLELESLQGVNGLRALRVGVRI